MRYKILDLVEYLPYVYRNSAVVEICRALTIELETYFTDLVESELEYNVSTATEKLKEWSDIVGIELDDKADIQTQREQILAAMKNNDITTAKLVKDIVESYSNATCEIKEVFGEYYFIIKFVDKVGIPKRIDLIKKSIDKVKPAHLGYRFEFKYRTWGDIKRTGITYRQSKEKEFTGKVLREGNIAPYDSNIIG